MNCAVQNCRQSSKKNPQGLSFHRFPVNEEKRNLWATRLGLLAQDVNPNRYICSLHFRREDITKVFVKKRWFNKLVDNALPIPFDAPDKLADLDFRPLGSKDVAPETPTMEVGPQFLADKSSRSTDWTDRTDRTDCEDEDDLARKPLGSKDVALETATMEAPERISYSEMEQDSDDSIIFEDVVIKEEINITEDDDNYYEQVDEELSPSEIPLEVKLVVASPVPQNPPHDSQERRDKVQNLQEALEENMRDPHCLTCYNRMLDLYNFMDIHPFVPKTSCNICLCDLPNEDMLKLHKQFYHPIETPDEPPDTKKTIKKIPVQFPIRKRGGKKILIKCPYCPRKCISNSQLRNHLASHSDERPFTCSFCPKTFKLKDSLSVHEQTHNKNRPEYHCTRCSGVFRCIYYFRKHLKKKHQIFNTGPHENEAVRYPAPSTQAEF